MRVNIGWALVVAMAGLGAAGAWAEAQKESKGAFAQAAIVVGEKADDLERLAGREVQRYLYRISGVLLPVCPDKVWGEQPTRPLIVVGTPDGNPAMGMLAAARCVNATREALGEQGFIVKAAEIEGRPVVAIAGATPVAVLYGAHTFLEQMGIGFYLGGDALPGHNLPLDVPKPLDIQQKPVFAIRGSLPWYNFLDSPTTWDVDDFKYFFDQVSKMKQNFVGFHTYDGEPFAPYERDGKLVSAGPLVTSQTYSWGTVRGLRTEEFGFGTGDYFDQDAFGSRATRDVGAPSRAAAPLPQRDLAIRRAQALLAEGLTYAKRRGIKVCVGFEVHGDPTKPEQQQAFEARLRELVRSYPMLDYVWLWQGESLGMKGADLPAVDSPLDVLVQEQRKHFEYLKDPRRIVEAVRMGEYVNLGHNILKRFNPEMRLIVSGWGGDKHMRFSDFYEGLDKVLPADVVFSALDNIDPAAEPNVSAVYGKLPPKRERWPIPWYESDGGPRRDQWCPETNTKEFTLLCRDALSKKCQGLLAIHWRTRDVEEAAAYTAQFAWEPDLTYEGFYRRFAAKCFGAERGEELGAVLRRLESLGPRWTGGGGQTECGRFTWVQGNQFPKVENLAALKEIRARLTQIRRETETSRLRRDIQEKGRTEGLERITHLITTIDWVMLYDAAAVKLCPEGPVQALIREAERLKRTGDPAAAARKAEEAWNALKSSGLREAMRTYPVKMTTRGEWGSLATINVKAYASYLELQERIWAHMAAPPPAEAGTALEQPLHVIVNTPPTIFPEKQPIPVSAAVVGPHEIAEVTLHYRKLGEGQFHSAAMQPAFRKTYRALVPGDAVAEEGVEFYVEAKDAAGDVACAPKGAVTYSGCVRPYPAPAVYPTPCVALPKVVQDYRVQAIVVDRPPNAKVRLRYRPTGGSGDYKTLDMTNTFCDSFEAVLPISEVVPNGIEYFIEVEGEWFKKWTGPPGGEKGPQKDIFDTDPPTAVQDLKAEVVGPYEVRISWSAAKDNRALAGYDVFRGGSSKFALEPASFLGGTYKTHHTDVHVKAGQTYWYIVRARDAAGNLGVAVESVSAKVPAYPPPKAPANPKASPGPGKIKISWDAMGLPVVGYNVYRTEAGGRPALLNTGGPVRQPVYLDGGLKDKTTCSYTVCAVDRGGQESKASEAVKATALPRRETPVFAAHFENSPDAENGMKGKLEGEASYAPGVVGQALDLTNGGWVRFNHSDVFDVTGELTLEAWVKFQHFEGMPVFLSHGHWRERGFFVQVLGGRIRFSLGGPSDLDAGRIEPGRWYYVVCTYDMKDMRVHLNGREVGRSAAPEVDLTPWVGPFYIGRYTLDGKPYEVCGLIDEVKVYQRARSGDEVRKDYEALSASLPAAR